MPIYEYRCRTCNEVSSFFVRTVSQSFEPLCGQCGGVDLWRSISSFAYHRSLKSVHEQSGPPPGPGVPSLDYYSDPRNVGRHAEDSFRRHGMEVPPSVRESIDAARDGTLPKGLDL